MTGSGGIAVGETAPDFTAPLVSPGGGTEPTALSDLLADRAVLLCFYTNDFSPDCVGEWCSFRDYEWFSANDRVQVVGISKSRPFTHRKFIDFLDLGFPLYSDVGLDVADAYGVSYRAFKVAARARRSCFLVDGERTVQYKWVGQHPLDPTMDSPEVADIHRAVTDVVGGDDPDTFGLT